MVTSFYIMQLSKNKSKSNNEDYYSELDWRGSRKSKQVKPSSCRVCLNEGEFDLCDHEKMKDIIEALKILVDIDVTSDHDFPKSLCSVCFKFVKQAILFRKVAKRTYDLLQLPVKEEKSDRTMDEQCDSYDYGNEAYESKNSWSNDEQETVNIKPEKSDSWYKLKQVPKVTCHICNKVMNRSYYKEHLTMHDPNHQKYVCDVCGKSFRLRCAYHNHSLRHRNDFPFKCQFCPYKARYKELLKTHMRVHTGDYRYMCTECPARFLFKSNLNTHMLKHKVPEFQCDTCKRAFHSKLSLQRHFEVDHLGIKNHVCNVCGKAFGYRHALMKHQRHVHKREKMVFGRMPSYLQEEQKS